MVWLSHFLPGLTVFFDCCTPCCTHSASSSASPALTLLWTSTSRHMVAPNPSTAAALPEALTARILQHVPQQQRLRQCALTCKAWAHAAALATTHVERDLKRGQTFNSWLEKYAGQLVSLQLAYNDYEELQLPPFGKLAKLQRLHLEGFKLLLPGEGDSSGSSGAATDVTKPLLLPSLQHLELSRVHLVSSSSLLQLAAAAPGLTSLKTLAITLLEQQFCSVPRISNNTKTAVQQLVSVIPSVLQQLPRLAVLELPGFPTSDAAVQQLGGMQGLQEVWFEHVRHMHPSNLQPLPSSITRLHLKGLMCEIGVPYNTPSLPPHLPQLAGLLQLELFQCNLLPTVLSAFTRLQLLKLWECKLQPEPDDPDSNISTEGTAALLDALAKMTRLQDLNLSLYEVDTVSTAPQLFAALTASTHLTQLVLEPEDVSPLVKGAVQFMFPANRQLPVLQHITISPRPDYPHDWEADKWCIDGADLTHIASCCPGLQCLDIALTVRPGADLSGLLKLPHSCTDLVLGGAAFGDSAASVLVQLTHLNCLCVHGSPGFTDVGLEQLADLNPTRLYVYSCALSEALSDEGTLDLMWDTCKGSVQQQLNELCDLSPLCAPARLRKQKNSIKQLRLENASLRLQLERSQAQAQQQQLKDAQMAGQ